jgi:hypothetical protein
VYAYSNNGLSWRSWDNPNNLAPGEVFFDHIPTAAELAAAFPGYTKAVANEPINTQIAALEAQQTPRLIREAMTGSTETNNNWKNPDGSPMTSAQRLAWIDSQIADLRLQLQELGG